MKLAFKRSALEDLRAISDYIKHDNPSAARSVAQRIRTAARRLSRFPFSGRVGSEPGTRELVVRGTPYIVIYQILEETGAPQVEVIAIVHGAMDRIGGQAADVLRNRLR